VKENRWTSDESLAFEITMPGFFVFFSLLHGEAAVSATGSQS
jgi:hypothetical protein